MSAPAATRPLTAATVRSTVQPVELESREFMVGVIEDSDEDYMVLTRSLRKFAPAASVRRWVRAEALLDDLAGGGLVDGTRPAVMVIDLSLPGIDGCELVQRLRRDSRTQDLPLLMLSGSARSSDIARCLEAGADDYFSKSARREDLQAMLRAVVGSATGERPRRSDIVG